MKNDRAGKTKILIVDDRPENILALSHLVAAPDVEIVSAGSGDEALAILLKHQVALALLDVQMPDVNGFELARLMRSAERTRAIPIIFVTATQGTAHTVFEGYDSGAVDFLTKPLNAAIVRSKVRVFVELDQRTRALQEKSEALQQKLREVEALKLAADMANQAKTMFLTNMSHEIRTPLGAVIGFSELLKYPNQSQKDRAACVASIQRNGKVLLKLVDDILDLSKIEADCVELEKIEMPLAEILADLKEVHVLKAQSKGTILNIVPEGRLPATITTDPVRLKQVLNNIIGNATKFTDKGTITVTVALAPPNPMGERLLKFSVADTGCGLSDQEVPRLFKPFMQADSSTTRKYGGTGLGLVISKKLATLLGGDVILLHSAKNAGSTFLITVDPGPIAESSFVDAETLMAKEDALEQNRDGNARSLAGIKVLIADDCADNRVVIGYFLELAGATVNVANDGVEALERVAQSSFDVVLMDIQMPGIDGYETTRKLRAKGYDKPIIALTAHAMKSELDRCLEAGCDFYLSKPVDRMQLIDAVAQYAHQSRTRSFESGRGQNNLTPDAADPAVV